MRQLEALAPFGQDNQVPCYMARNVTLVNPRAVGADKNHFSCGLTDGRVVVAGIMFHCDDIDELMANEGVVDAAFTLQVDEWRGRFSVKAMLKALAPARTCCALRACLNPEAQTLLEGLYAEDDQQLCADAVAPDPAVAEGAMASVKENRAKWEAAARENPDGLEQALITALIGARAVARIAAGGAGPSPRAGKSTFAVMATGRGKSLTFTGVRCHDGPFLAHGQRVRVPAAGSHRRPSVSFGFQPASGWAWPVAALNGRERPPKSATPPGCGPCRPAASTSCSPRPSIFVHATPTRSPSLPPRRLRRGGRGPSRAAVQRRPSRGLHRFRLRHRETGKSHGACRHGHRPRRSGGRRARTRFRIDEVVRAISPA